MSKWKQRVAVGSLLATGVWAAWAGVASAHLDPDKSEVKAGSTETVTFNMEHGCGESGAVQLAMQIPGSVANPKPQNPPGWTSSVNGSEVVWVGGPQPAHQELGFAIELTFPTTTGELQFPAVEKCEKGEIKWIEQTPAGGDEPEHPVPVITVGDQDKAAVPDAAASSDAGSASDATTEAPSTTIGTATTSTSDDSGIGTGGIIGIVAAVVVVVGGIGAVVLRNRKGSGDGPSDPAGTTEA